MAHEIMEDDNMFSVRERPWHGLGDVLDTVPSVDMARQHYLNWEAHLSPLQAVYEVPGTNNVINVDVPGKQAVVREDTKRVIGVVGSRYTIYQNSQMWDFIDTFQKRTRCKLETAGSLRNGETVWVLTKGMEWEVINGDTIEEFFLIKNGFDGATPISVMNTDIRVVCNNTLSMALRGAGNIYNVRHVKSVDQYMDQVDKALGIRARYHDEVVSKMTDLSKIQLTDARMRELLEVDVFPVPMQTVQTVGVDTDAQADDAILTPVELTDRAKRMKAKKINKIMELVETGAGADIKGVRGTGYGLFQALVEWHDHERTVRPGNRDIKEAKFENAFFNGVDFKQHTVDVLLKAA